MLAWQDNIRKDEQDNGVIRWTQGPSPCGSVFPLDLEPKGQA